MSIVSELGRLAMAKEDFKNILEEYENKLPANIRTEDMPPLLVGMPILETPYVKNYEEGWVNSTGTFNANATWTWQTPQGAVNDIYKLKNGHKYSAYICVPGTRFRVMYCTQDPTNPGGVNVTGKSIAKRDNPTAGSTWNTGGSPNWIFTAPYDCFLIIQKDNAYNYNIKSYVLDLTFIGDTVGPTWVTNE